MSMCLARGGVGGEGVNISLWEQGGGCCTCVCVLVVVVCGWCMWGLGMGL